MAPVVASDDSPLVGWVLTSVPPVLLSGVGCSVFVTARSKN
jgi:hypothetical protein